MTQRPSYEELEQRIKVLEKEALERMHIDKAVKESEERFKTLVANIPGATYRCALDSDWTMEFISDGIEDISGYPASDFINNSIRTYESIIHRDDSQKVAEAVSDAVNNRRPYTIDYRIIRNNGKIRHVYERGQGILDDNGDVKWLDGIIFDITEHKLAEKALQESEERYRNFVQNTSELIYRFDYLSPIPLDLSKEEISDLAAKRAVVSEVNDAVAKRYKVNPDKIIGMPPTIFVPDFKERALEAIKEWEEDFFKVKNGSFHNKEIETINYDSEGNPFWVSSNYTTIVEDGKAVRVWGVQRDISEKKKVAENLKRSEQQLRSLTIRLQEIEETERKKLSRELHDQVGQNLTALNINLNILRNQLFPESLEQASTRLEDSIEIVEETTRIIRDVMSELRPSVLDDYGLSAALRWYGERFAERTGISVKILKNETLSRLPDSMESSLFRIAQEALTNVAKHANASEVILNLEDTHELFRLVIADNGKGFDYNAVINSNIHNSWGIINMQERAQGLGGRIRVISKPDKGTEIAVELRK